MPHAAVISLMAGRASAEGPLEMEMQSVQGPVLYNLCMDKSIFRAYDIRGVYPTELNEQDAYQI